MAKNAWLNFVRLAGSLYTGAATWTPAALLARSNHTGTQSADTIVDGTTNKAFLATERTKLAGIATGATANATDAQLRDRSTHTGTQSADTIVDGTTNKAFAATERTKLAGIANGATANSPDATLLARANHTGTQAISTVTGLQTALDAKAPLASPALTGLVTVPTIADSTDSSTKAASTAFVQAVVAALVAASPGTLDTLAEIAAALGDDPNFATTITTLIAAKAAKESNLSDLSDSSAARSNLGLGSIATHGESEFVTAESYSIGQSAIATSIGNCLQVGNSLSDVASAATARTNLGLGTMATQEASSYAALAGAAFSGAVSFVGPVAVGMGTDPAVNFRVGGGPVRFPALADFSSDTWLPFSNGKNYIRGETIIGDVGGGNVGIGTNSPSEKLHVNGNGLFTGAIRPGSVDTQTTPGDYPGQIYFDTSMGSGAFRGWVWDGSTWLEFGRNGWSGSFTVDGGSHTVNVVNGIITSLV